MKSKCLFLFLVLAATAAHAKTILPDACGDAKIDFSIDKKTSDGKMPAPSEGKALLVIEYPVIWTGLHIGTGGGNLRVGMDGQWLGAAESDSYFTVEIAPGEHHLCVTEAGAFGGAKKDGIAMSRLTAEAGKSYFFQYKLTYATAYKAVIRNNSFEPVDEDEGRFRVKSLKRSEWTVRPPDTP